MTEQENENGITVKELRRLLFSFYNQDMTIRELGSVLVNAEQGQVLKPVLPIYLQWGDNYLGECEVENAVTQIERAFEQESKNGYK